MAQQISEIKASARPLSGKGGARAVRREGRVPGVVYGDKRDVENTWAQLVYDGLGLLQSKLDARGGQSEYSYDAQGRLTLAQNAVEGSLQLTRTGKAPLATVTRRSAEGLQAGYTTQALSTDIERRTTLREDGRSERLDTRPDQLQRLTQFDGTLITSTPGPDPVWGMAQPLSSSVTERLPSGSTRTIIETRNTGLPSPGGRGLG